MKMENISACWQSNRIVRKVVYSMQQASPRVTLLSVCEGYVTVALGQNNSEQKNPIFSYSSQVALHKQFRSTALLSVLLRHTRRLAAPFDGKV